MSDQKASIGEQIAWSLAIICVACVLLSPAACTMNRHAKIAEAIKAGADPIAAKCAIEGDIEHTPMCISYAANQKR